MRSSRSAAGRGIVASGPRTSTGDLETELRALVARVLPGVPESIDLAAFVDAHADDPIGRGDRPPGLPPNAELLRSGLRALAGRGFARGSAEDQDGLIARMRRGEADDELGVPAMEFVDRLLVKALAGYLAHPDTWERIGFHGPSYPEGCSWIGRQGALPWSAKDHVLASGMAELRPARRNDTSRDRHDPRRRSQRVHVLRLLHGRLQERRQGRDARHVRPEGGRGGGTDPETSVVGPDCRTHDIPNL